MPGCGPCNLCCDLMGVEMQPLEDAKKPPFQPCKHQCSAKGGEGGCGVYESRPDSCRVFQCHWLWTQKQDPEYRLPKFLRPDKTGVVAEINSHGNIAIHCRGDEWKRKPVYGYLIAMTQRTTVIVGRKTGRHFRLNGDHTVSFCSPCGTDAIGNVMYVVHELPSNRIPVSAV